MRPEDSILPWLPTSPTYHTSSFQSLATRDHPLASKDILPRNHLLEYSITPETFQSINQKQKQEQKQNMLRFIPFVTLLLLAAVSGETLSDPGEIEGQEDLGLAVEEEVGRELVYEDARGQRYWSEDPFYDSPRGERLDNGRYYGTEQMAGARGDISGQRYYERPGERASVYDWRGQRYSNDVALPEQAGYRAGNVRGSYDERLDPVGFLGDAACCTAVAPIIAVSCSATAIACLLACPIKSCADNCNVANELSRCTDYVDTWKDCCF